MKIVTIKDLQAVEIACAQLDDPATWVAECVASNAWGKPERIVLHKDEPMAEPYDEADVLEDIIEEVSPAVEAVMDDQGVEVSPAIEAVTVKKVKLKAQYTIEIEDITAQVAQEAINADALAYLAATDWLIIREVDAGVACPADIKAERAAARARVVR